MEKIKKKDKPSVAKIIVDKLISSGHKVEVIGNFVTIEPPDSSSELMRKIIQCSNEIKVYVESLKERDK